MILQVPTFHSIETPRCRKFNINDGIDLDILIVVCPHLRVLWRFFEDKNEQTYTNRNVGCANRICARQVGGAARPLTWVMRLNIF